MKEDLFEGYVGIRLAEGQLGNDIVLSLFLCMLVLFAIHFRRNAPYYMKIFPSLIHTKERQSLFDESIGNTYQNHLFGSFQFVFLYTLIVFMLFVAVGRIGLVDSKTTFIYLLAIFGVLLLFFLFKQLIYFVLGIVFAEQNKYHLWKDSYFYAIDLWGILLYLPTVLLLFAGKIHVVPLVLLIILYLSNRIIIILKAIRIFFNKKTSVLLIILYLCALEILPLLFLYEGLIFINYIIEINSLWL